MANIFEKNKTYLGDCMELMPQMETGMFDMILCDLPYGTTTCKWDTIIPFEPLWKEYERLIKPNGVIVLTATQPFTTDLINSNRKWFRYEMIWVKSSVSSPMLCNKRPLPKHENILVFYKSQPTYNPQKTYSETNRIRKIGKRNIIADRGESIYGGINVDDRQYDKTRFPSSVLEYSNPPRNNQFTKKHSLHPTQKPKELFEFIINSFTNKGELILDNCAGSGTTGEACFNTGRNYIQIEKEQKYFDLILGREKSFNKKDNDQESLFGEQM